MQCMQRPEGDQECFMQMASLRGEIGCTGANSMRQWRAATFHNLPVTVNLNRLAAFVSSAHVFRCFCNAFSEHFNAVNTSTCSSSSCPSSLRHEAPVFHPFHSDGTQREECTRSSYYGDGCSTFSNCNSSSQHEALSDGHERCHHIPDSVQRSQHSTCHKAQQYGAQGSQHAVSSATSSHCHVSLLYWFAVS